MVNVSGGTLVVDRSHHLDAGFRWGVQQAHHQQRQRDPAKRAASQCRLRAAAQITDKANQLGLSGGTLLLTSANDYTVDQLKKAETTLTGISTPGLPGRQTGEQCGRGRNPAGGRLNVWRRDQRHHRHQVRRGKRGQGEWQQPLCRKLHECGVGSRLPPPKRKPR